MKLDLHDQMGCPTLSQVELPEDLVLIPGLKTTANPWIAVGRDGAAVVMVCIPRGAGEGWETDTSVPITIRFTYLTLKQVKDYELKQGATPRNTLLRRLIDRLRLMMQETGGLPH